MMMKYYMTNVSAISQVLICFTIYCTASCAVFTATMIFHFARLFQEKKADAIFGGCQLLVFEFFLVHVIIM